MVDYRRNSILIFNTVGWVYAMLMQTFWYVIEVEDCQCDRPTSVKCDMNTNYVIVWSVYPLPLPLYNERWLCRVRVGMLENIPPPALRPARPIPCKYNYMFCKINGVICTLSQMINSLKLRQLLVNERKLFNFPIYLIFF